MIARIFRFVKTLIYLRGKSFLVGFLLSISRLAQYDQINAIKVVKLHIFYISGRLCAVHNAPEDVKSLLKLFLILKRYLYR